MHVIKDPVVEATVWFNSQYRWVDRNLGEGIEDLMGLDRKSIIWAVVLMIENRHPSGYDRKGIPLTDEDFVANDAKSRKMTYSLALLSLFSMTNALDDWFGTKRHSNH